VQVTGVLFSREKVQGIWDSENDDEVKPPRYILPFALRKTTRHLFEFHLEWTQLCLLPPRQSRFFSPGLVHIMTYCNNLHERTSPIEIFFFGHTLSRPRPTGRCPDLYAMLPKSISPMHSNQLRSILVSTPEKKSLFRSSFVHYPVQLIRGISLHYLHLPPTDWKEFISRLLCTFPVFVQYTLSLLNSFVLRSSAFLGISKTDP